MLRLNHVDDTHCQGIVFEVTDIDALARTIAFVLVQEYELARQLVTGDSPPTGAITLENGDIEDIIQRRLHPTVDYHRDGFLFQLMMWLAAHLDLEAPDYPQMPTNCMI